MPLEAPVVGALGRGGETAWRGTWGGGWRRRPCEYICLLRGAPHTRRDLLPSSWPRLGRQVCESVVVTAEQESLRWLLWRGEGESVQREALYTDFMADAPGGEGGVGPAAVISCCGASCVGTFSASFRKVRRWKMSFLPAVRLMRAGRTPAFLDTKRKSLKTFF